MTGLSRSPAYAAGLTMAEHGRNRRLRPMATLDPDAMAANIRTIYAMATADDLARGRDWYPCAGRIAATLAEWSGSTAETVAAVIAALSPRNPWKWNVQDAAAFVRAAADGGAMPSATTFGANRRTAWSYANGSGDWKTAAPKVRSFVRNITGDTSAVTVDVWAIRVATMGELSAVPRGAYDAVSAAYRTIAAETGETPRELQAIVWTVAERIGLGSNRKGRGHTVKCKRGTFPIVAALVGAE